jgi:hypothetical protein
MQALGSQGNAQQQMVNGTAEALQKAVKDLAQKTIEAWNIAKTVKPELGAYFTKMAEVGSAIEQEVKKMSEQQGQSGAQQPQPGTSAPSPSDGGPA